MKFPDPGELEKEFQVGWRQAGGSEDRDALRESKPGRVLESAGAQIIQSLIETGRFAELPPQSGLPRLVPLLDFL